MNHWKNDKRWSDLFLPEVKKILGLHLIGEPPVEEDQERNTDLIVLKMEAVRIGCRIRKNSFLHDDRCPDAENEFTIRASRPSGVKTELTKIIEGWGDYFFYGFASATDNGLEKWLLGDLKVFRLFFASCLYKGDKRWIEKKNKDGSSAFFVFNVNDLPDNFLVARLD